LASPNGSTARTTYCGWMATTPPRVSFDAKPTLRHARS
jgi:hypothetical protein